MDKTTETKSIAEQVMDSKNVCSDLINRLQSQLPKSSSGLYGTMASPPTEDKLSSLEEGIRKLQERIDGLMGDKTPPPDPEKAMTEKITGELQDIVESFNKSFAEWSARTGCVVNFSWSYRDGKRLEVAGIDYIVYRREAPSAKTMKEVVERVAPAALD